MNYMRCSNQVIRESIIKLLEIKDSYIRITTLRQGAESVDKGIHIGGAFSSIIPLVALYYGGFINTNIENPTEKGSDIFVLSKGHVVAAMASIYADIGYFDSKILKNSRSMESILNGHPGPILPGVHISTGPLGQGLSAASGFASIGQNSPKNDVYCMTGDGELHEGGIWEGVMYSGIKRLDNLCVIVDKNNGQLDSTNQLVLPVENLEEKFISFGWKVYNVDGTKYETIYEALKQFKTSVRDGRPTVIISNCSKGYGGFSDFINKHKVNVTDTFIRDETALQEARLNERKNEFIRYFNGITKDNNEIQEYILSQAERMNIKICINENGIVDEIKFKDTYVKTKRVPELLKEVKYDSNMLPRLDKNKEYTASQIISDTMKVFAKDKKVVSVDSDLSSVSGLQQGIASVDRSRALNAGIAEANMMNIGEAYAASGYNVWVSTFCPFFEWRVLRRIAVGFQERMEAIQAIETEGGWLSEGHGLDMTFVATAPDFETQTNGATHMGNDDITIFSGMGHLKIINVSCPQQLIGVMKWIAQGNKGLVYLRILRGASKVLYDTNFEFEFGKGYYLRSHDEDKAIFISSGREVYEVMDASKKLEECGIYTGVIDMPSFDEDLMLSLADSGKQLIFAEQNNGYLWSCFMKTMFKHRKNVDMDRFVPINTLDDNWNPKFIHSGVYNELVERFNLSSDKLVGVIKQEINY